MQNDLKKKWGQMRREGEGKGKGLCLVEYLIMKLHAFFVSRYTDWQKLIRRRVSSQFSGYTVNKRTLLSHSHYGGRMVLNISSFEISRV